MSEADDELIEVRCRSCGYFMGYRRRTGAFVFWCSKECANQPMAKFDRDQIRDEVATELYLQDVPMMAIARFTKTPYTRIQQLLMRRGVTLGRRERAEAS